MYKIKLQELCQKRQWGLPRYEASKLGSDHAPRFAAAVFVDGLQFWSDEGDSVTFRSSKEAQNDAARVAFLHLSASQPPPPPPTPLASAAPPCEISSKNQLQIFAQKMNMNLPVYGSVRDGPPHAPRFKATVVMDSRTFESPVFFTTLKEAEHAAARVALEAMSLLGPECIPFKDLLQEFCLKEGLKYPIYATESSGPSHSPDFISTVDIDGEKFLGVPVKTKKQAEILAAKAALSILKAGQGKLCSQPASSRIVKTQEALQNSSDCSSSIVGNCLIATDTVISNSGTMFDSDSGSEIVYKNLLQCFAQRKNITLPVYECVREGPSHSPSFKASVIIDGQTFETTGFSHTIKEAEQAAARIAFETLTHGVLDQKELTSPFKVLLQELCLKQGLCLPIYETSSSGSSHLPVFISNVKVDGETFIGKPAKNKKLAELFAAELAWTTLKKSKKQTQKSFDSQISELREALERSTLCSTSVIMNDISEKNEGIVDTFTAMQLVPHGTGVKLTGSSSKVKVADGNDLFQQSCRSMTKLIFSQNLASTGQENFSDVERGLDSPHHTMEDKSSLPLEQVENNFSDSFNKILVFSRASSVQPPSGSVKLPIQDDKWMAVQFECPAGTA